MRTPPEGLYYRCSKNYEISHFGFLAIRFRIGLSWDHMEVKVSNDISSENKQQIHCPKFIHHPPGDFFQSGQKIVKCETLHSDIYFLFYFFPH